MTDSERIERLRDALENSVQIMQMAQMVEQMRGMKDAGAWDKPIKFAQDALNETREQA
jgi:hypothetical protein